MSNFNDDIENDSFDEILANIPEPTASVPSQPKKPKLSADSKNDESFEDNILANLTIPTATPSTSTASSSLPSSTTNAALPSVNVANTNKILVHPKQRGNPILKSIQSVPWEFDDTIVPDYVVGSTACILFLSLRYHQLNPDYIHNRLKLLGKKFELRILLVQVDTKVMKTHNSLILLGHLTIFIENSLRRIHITR